MIRNIWAVGRNYADHAHELGNALPSSPLIFLKAGSTAVQGERVIQLPKWPCEIHHEIELALEFGPDLNVRRAAIALDLTDRPKQIELRNRGEPWTLAKSFTASCPLSSFFDFPDPDAEVELRLTVNGQLRQSSSTALMLFKPSVLLDYVRSRFPVCPGDLLLTGTPAGVAALRSGDQVLAEILGCARHEWRVVDTRP